MINIDLDWQWSAPKEPGLYIVFRGDVESPENCRGAITVYVSKREDAPDKVWWTSTDPNGNDTIGDFADWPESYKLAKVGE